MAKKTSRQRSLDNYIKAIEAFAPTEKWAKSLAQDETKLKELLRKLPSGSLPADVQPALNDIYELKDLMRTIRKTTATLRKHINQAGVAYMQSDVDHSFIRQSLRSQRLILRTITSSMQQLDQRRRKLISYLENIYAKHQKLAKAEARGAKRQRALPLSGKSS